MPRGDRDVYAAVLASSSPTATQSTAGRVAAELLFDMIDNGRHRSEVADVVLAPNLVVRRSAIRHEA